MSGLVAPFPYYGGKRRWVDIVWERFGAPDVYAEPFAGSCAVLLGRPGQPGRREVVCDLNGFVCNFWRAIRSDPDAVAHHADYPTVHQDLTARHRWLVRWGREHRDKLSEDPDWHDVKAAGWWVWGASLWIGHGWCLDRTDPLDKVPYTSDSSDTGVSRQSDAADKIPYASKNPGARGIAAQRDVMPRVQAEISDRRRERLEPWFQALSDRLHGVIVLNRDWRSAVTPTVLSDTASSPRVARAVFLDPPYLLENRKRRLYPTDVADPDAQAARDAHAWALEYGNREDYRVAYCCGAGDFAFPDDWICVTDTLQGVRRPDRRGGATEAVYFSPACRVAQGELFQMMDAPAGATTERSGRHEKEHGR